MFKRVSEKELISRSISLAKSTRQKILEAGLEITDYQSIASYFDISLRFGNLPNGKDGSYIKQARKIVLNSQVQNGGNGGDERLNFTFFHELMHALIEDDENLLSDFADAYIRNDGDLVMERMCNAGAAELLIPVQDIFHIVQKNGFSTNLIPELCCKFRASSLAVAFQLIRVASHRSYLVIAEPSASKQVPNTLQLTIIYTASSPAEKYTIARDKALPADSLLYEVWLLGERKSKKGDDRIPFASGRGWIVSCDALRFRGKVFAFFNVEPPHSPHQLPLLNSG